MEDPGTSAVKEQTAPHEEDARKPDSPPELKAPSWKYTFKRAVAEFSHDQCTDLAAALTYYSVLALFPALVALVSLVGVFGQGEASVNTMLELVRQLGGSSAANTIEGPIRAMVNTPAAGAGLVIGLVGALWSASGYVGAFSRALNRVYEVDEGRTTVKLRLQQLLLTAVVIVLVALILIGLVVSGPLIDVLGNALGVGEGAKTTWSILKWPIMLAAVILIVATLYYFTPNVKQPKFRWISIGAIIAILIWIIASVAFGFYVSNFGSYNKTYGSLAGVIVFLLWLWLTNLALLFGAEVDSELERSRQLQGGIKAEESLQLPPKDSKASDKAAEKHAKVVAQGRALRKSAGEVAEAGSADGGAPAAKSGVKATTTGGAVRVSADSSDSSAATATATAAAPAGLVNAVSIGGLALVAAAVIKRALTGAAKDQRD